jgi:hypothetical protein
MRMAVTNVTADAAHAHAHAHTIFIQTAHFIYLLLIAKSLGPTQGLSTDFQQYQFSTKNFFKTVQKVSTILQLHSVIITIQ